MKPTSSILSLFALILLVNGKNPKRGLAFADSSNAGDIKKANTSSSVISWQYSWSSSPSGTLAQSGIQYVPMQWGVSGITNFVSVVKSQGANVVLGFNEPDLSSQSNIDPVTAASLWKQYINPLSASGVRLGAPAVTSGSNGLPWLSKFFGACTGCKIDFIPLHWYGTGISNFEKYLTSAHAQFPDYPLWVTEFASTSSDVSEVQDFLAQATKYLDGLDWVERYAWFAYFRPGQGGNYNLLDANGALNDMGKIYVNGN